MWRIVWSFVSCVPIHKDRTIELNFVDIVQPVFGNHPGVFGNRLLNTSSLGNVILCKYNMVFVLTGFYPRTWDLKNGLASLHGGDHLIE